eukprot:scaffold97273_cov67-Phaeocystis_antarctica.AAC.5
MHVIVPALLKGVRSTRPLCEASVPEGRRVRRVHRGGHGTSGVHEPVGRAKALNRSKERYS